MDTIQSGFRESAISLYTRGEIISSWQSFLLVFLTTLGFTTIVSRIMVRISNIILGSDDDDDDDDASADTITIDDETDETNETDSDDTTTVTDENIRGIQNILSSHQDI